jgi:phage minor structural protein
MERLLVIGGEIMDTSKFPQIYTINFRRLAILSEALDISVEYEINTWNTLKFTLPSGSLQWAWVSAERYVKYENKWFILQVDNLDREESTGVVKSQVECPGLGADLTRKMNQVIGDFLPGSAELIPLTDTAVNLMAVILENTGWSVGTVTVDETKSRTIGSEWQSVVTNLSEIAEKFNGELVYDDSDPLDKKVHLLEDLGPDFEPNPFTFQYAKNIKGMSRNIDSRELVTRLFAFGHEDLTVNDITEVDGHPRPIGELGQSYMQNFQWFLAQGYTQQEIDDDIAIKGEASAFIKVGEFRDHDYTNDLELYKDAKDKLDQEMSLPVMSYDISFANMTSLPEWAHESYEIGQWGTMFDSNLNIDIDVRIVRYVDYPNSREKNEVSVINRPDQLGDIMASTIQTAGKIEKNKVMHSLLRNFIDLQAASINGANGYLIISDWSIDAIHLDEFGEPTGGMLRYSPGGIGVSSDAGQTFDYAMTYQGLLAKYVVVNELNAVLTDEGRARVTHLGFEVYDDSERKRAHMGQFEPGRFGLMLRNAAGNRTILDDTGLMQSWSDTIIDNLDAVHRLVFKVYIPPETLQIHSVKLSFILENFRAYSKGAEAGGGVTLATPSGGGHTTINGGGSTSGYQGSHRHQMFYFSGGTPDVSQRGFSARNVSGSAIELALNTALGQHLYTYAAADSHRHSTPNHNHAVANHSHSVVIPAHTHPIEYGIYQSTKATNVKVYVNDTLNNRLGGANGYVTDQINLDLTQWMNIGWNTIELSSSQLGRLNATYFCQIFMGA